MKKVYIYSLYNPVGFHEPDAAAPKDLCLAMPSLSSAKHTPFFLSEEFRTKIARAEGVVCT